MALIAAYSGDELSILILDEQIISIKILFCFNILSFFYLGPADECISVTGRSTLDVHSLINEKCTVSLISGRVIESIDMEAVTSVILEPADIGLLIRSFVSLVIDRYYLNHSFFCSLIIVCNDILRDIEGIVGIVDLIKDVSVLILEFPSDKCEPVVDLSRRSSEYYGRVSRIFVFVYRCARSAFAGIILDSDLSRHTPFGDKLDVLLYLAVVIR